VPGALHVGSTSQPAGVCRIGDPDLGLQRVVLPVRVLPDRADVAPPADPDGDGWLVQERSARSWVRAQECVGPDVTG